MTEKGLDQIYDDVVCQVGNDGKYQRNFNYLFNFVFVIFSTMASFNIVLLMAVPEHWCKVPGRDLTNFTLEEWKNFKIPWKNDSFGNQVFEKCSMNFNESTQECHFGMEYDQTWYTETIPSQQDWVCNDSIKVTNSFAMNRAGEIIGTFLFGQLGDRYGRKPTFFISLFLLILGRLGLLFTTNLYYIFMVLLLIGNMSSLAIFQSPLIIGIEITKDEDRASISLLQCVSWTFGLVIMPMIFWYFGDWYRFLIATSLPLIPFLFMGSLMVESPRWLATRGKLNRCFKELKKIGKVNGKSLTDKQMAVLNTLADSEEQDSGILTLFSTFSLAKVTCLSMIAWICYILTYVTMFLNITNLAGNPFMNFFWQGLAELPGYIVGKYLTDYLGRNVTRLFSFVATALGCFVLVFFIRDPNQMFIVNSIAVFLKFINAVSFYCLNLHSLELYPTSLRQTGLSVGNIAGFASGLLAPYIVYLGTEYDVRYPYIVMTLLCLMGGVVSFGLPETLNQKLPETIEDVSNFVKTQSWWKVSPPRRASYVECPKTDGII